MRIIRGKYGRRRFDVPSAITARPTTDFARENIFNVIENMLDLEGISALDLFAGTGAVSFELLSRGAARVTSVENARVQANFIANTAKALGDTNLHLVKGDALRFIAAAPARFDFIFADPPYNHPKFGEIAPAILASGMLKEGGLFVMEHGKDFSYEDHPWFVGHRAYGSVNFSLFVNPGAESSENSGKEEVENG